jgi:anthranilate/para-aminobenzoate synthase component I
MTRDQFENAVLKGKEYIKAGDIFQFVPSQRLRVTSDADPFDVLPRAAHHQSVPIHVLSEVAAVHADRQFAGDPVPGYGWQR